MGACQSVEGTGRMPGGLRSTLRLICGLLLTSACWMLYACGQHSTPERHAGGCAGHSGRAEKALRLTLLSASAAGSASAWGQEGRAGQELFEAFQSTWHNWAALGRLRHAAQKQVIMHCGRHDGPRGGARRKGGRAPCGAWEAACPPVQTRRCRPRRCSRPPGWPERCPAPGTECKGGSGLSGCRS